MRHLSSDDVEADYEEESPELLLCASQWLAIGLISASLIIEELFTSELWLNRECFRKCAKCLPTRKERSVLLISVWNMKISDCRWQEWMQHMFGRR